MVTVMPSKKNPCVPGQALDSAKMDLIAAVHVEREKCFVDKLIKRFENDSCIPRFLQSYLLNISSEWCIDNFKNELLGPLDDILNNHCPAPCTSISYEQSMEPFHGADNVIPSVCGGPAIVMDFKVDTTVNFIEVRNCDFYFSTKI